VISSAVDLLRRPDLPDEEPHISLIAVASEHPARQRVQTCIQPTLYYFIRGVDHRQYGQRHVMVELRYSPWCTVQNSKRALKHDLECLRLASDCIRLVGDVSNHALQRHFFRTANIWTAKAERGLAADSQETEEVEALVVQS
jgi:hypothetical protein